MAITKREAINEIIKQFNEINGFAPMKKAISNIEITGNSVKAEIGNKVITFTYKVERKVNANPIEVSVRTDEETLRDCYPVSRLNSEIT